MAFTFWIASIFLHKHDIALMYSPPLTLGLASWGLRLIKRIPFILNVQDLFPQSIIDLGLLKNSKIIRFFEWLERFVYHRSDRITVHSEGNRRHVLRKEIPEVKIDVLHNWVDTDFIQPGSRMNTFRREFDLGESFVVSFAGVLGYSQDIGVILEAADLLKSHTDISWVIVGDGVEKERLSMKSDQMGLTKVQFIPMQPRDKYPEVLRASDVSLTTLHRDVKTPVVPSKILSIMAAGRPVVAAMDLKGDAPKLIETAKCGFCLPPGNSKMLAEKILSLYQDRNLCQEMGMNGRKYAEEHLSLSACVSKYETLFQQIVTQ